MILAGTGHRPDKLGGLHAQTDARLLVVASGALQRLETRPAEVISGMALGWDQALAQAALDLGIPVRAALPFPGQELRWPRAYRERYHALLARCATVVYTSQTCRPDDVAVRMQIRNEYMVDACTLLLALWNGTPGGTRNCLSYATDRVPMINVWDDYLKEWRR